ncbi:hypothetical protein B0H19DRAFT_1245742 [Mycena capillaripes]|nr:hypothetical protein B0H19DRAFT_1245742 [Mycena capillaripes]
MDVTTSQFFMTDAEIALGSSWPIPYSFGAYLSGNIHPIIFYIQLAVDPTFSAPARFVELSDIDHVDVRKALGRLLEQLRVVLLAYFPTIPLKNSEPSVRLLAPSIPSHSFNIFRLLESFLAHYGQSGDLSVSESLSSVLGLLVSASKASVAAQTISASDEAFIEYRHFLVSGNLAKFPVISFPRLPPSPMALRFALSRDVVQGTTPLRSTRSQYEVFFIDFDTHEELTLYLRRPEVINYCHNVLSPLRDIVMLVRDRFRSQAPQPKDIPWLRQQLSQYLRLLDVVAHAIGPAMSVAQGKRIPTPTTVSQGFMLRLIRKFGFDGDNIEAFEEHHLNNLSIVFQHAADTAGAMSARLADVPRESAPSTPELLVIPNVHSDPKSVSIIEHSFVQGDGSDTDVGSNTVSSQRSTPEMDSLSISV